METEYTAIKGRVRRGRPPLSDEERKRSKNRSGELRRCASLARSRTLMVFKDRYPEEYKLIYGQEYRALKRERLS